MLSNIFNVIYSRNHRGSNIWCSMVKEVATQQPITRSIGTKKPKLVFRNIFWRTFSLQFSRLCIIEDKFWLIPMLWLNLVLAQVKSLFVARTQQGPGAACHIYHHQAGITSPSYFLAPNTKHPALTHYTHLKSSVAVRRPLSVQFTDNCRPSIGLKRPINGI